MKIKKSIIFFLIFSIILIIYFLFFSINKKLIGCYMAPKCLNYFGYEGYFIKDYNNVFERINKQHLTQDNIGKSALDIYGFDSIFLNNYAKVVLGNIFLMEVSEDNYLFELNVYNIFGESDKKTVFYSDMFLNSLKEKRDCTKNSCFLFIDKDGIVYKFKPEK